MFFHVGQSLLGRTKQNPLIIKEKFKLTDTLEINRVSKQSSTSLSLLKNSIFNSRPWASFEIRKSHNNK